MSVSTTDVPVLDVRDLHVRVKADDAELSVVSGVSFTVGDGETVALVGESGAGKSMTALSIMRLAETGALAGNLRLTGQLLFRDARGEVVDLLAIDAARLRAIRGSAISMVFQEPMTALNPVMRVGEQIAEAVRAHERVGAAGAAARALDMLRLVGIPDPAARQRAFPHELSGGMRQRVMIAIALACRPRLLIADEPTTALDVSVQAQVLDLIRALQRELRMAVLFITHDLGVVAQMADRVAVMYAGRIVETAPVEALFATARHPYTAGLLRSMPNAAGTGGRVQPIPGVVPSPGRLPSGCAFHPRCAVAVAPRCAGEMPGAESAGERHSVRCWRWREHAATASAG